MKRRSSPGRWRAKSIVILLLCFSVASLVVMQGRYSLVMRSSAEASPPPVQKPKIAFLFIARNRLPLDLVWEAFFQGEKEGRFSIHVHSRPGFLFNKATTQSAYFYGRQVNNSIQAYYIHPNSFSKQRGKNEKVYPLVSKPGPFFPAWNDGYHCIAKSRAKSKL